MNQYTKESELLDQTKSSFFTGEDSLLDCLIYISSLHERFFSKKELTSGLPLTANKLTPRVFVRAAERAGFDAQPKKLPMKKLARHRLPAIILLENDQALLALATSENAIEYECWVPGEGLKTIAANQISEQYTGYSIVLKILPHFDVHLESAHNKSARRWFWRVINKSSHIYRDVLLASFMINVFALASPLFIMNVYDRVVPNQAVVTLWVLVIGVLIVFGFDLLLRSVRGYLIDHAGKKSDIELSSRIYEKVLNVNMASRPKSVGAFANHLDEFENVRNFITSATISTFIDLPFVFMFLFVVWFVAGDLVVVPLVAIPLILVYALLMQVPIKRAVEKSQLGSAQKSASLMEGLIGIETIKVLGAESQLQGKLEDVAGYVSDWRIRSKLLSASVVNFAVFVQQIVTVGVVAYGVYLIADQQLSLGALIAAVILSGRIMAPMGQMANLATHFHQTQSALRVLDKIMALETDISQERTYINLSDVKGDIEFDKVYFSYIDDRYPVLTNVNLHIKQGEHVGIIGKTGSGKSTIEKLILGLYQPDSGAVRLDGIDIQQIAPAEVRGNIGFVQQDIMLFYGTLRENLVFGNPMVSDELLLKAAELSGIMEMVKQHPLGFDMPIGERGVGLSGGQRQSVAVARAILHEPNVLVMDEPSNAMDNATENRLLKNLEDFIEDKTLLLVTHKGSMLGLVDRLIVVDRGKIVADGEKSEVLAALKSGQVHG